MISEAIDRGLRKEDTGAVLAWSAGILVVGFLTALLSIARHRTMSKIRMEANFGISREIVRKATSLGAELERRIHGGQVASIGLGDVGAVSASLTVTGPGVGAIVSYGVIAVLLFSISANIALLVLLGVPLICVIVGPLLNRLLYVQSQYRKQQGDLSTLLIDIVGGLRILNAFGGKDAYAERYMKQSKETLHGGFAVSRVSSWIGAVAVGLPAVFLGVVTWIAARSAAGGDISVGNLVAIYGFMAVLVVPISFLIEGGDQLSRGTASARRIISFLRLKPAPLSSSNYAAPACAAALRDSESGVLLNPKIFAALVSENPEDASRILNRLAGFIPSDVTWGRQRLDQIDLEAVRGRILLADHEAAIFSGTLRSHILADREMSDSEVIRALWGAAAEDMLIQAEDGGLSGEVSSSARNFSGGQRQRLRLARAIGRDAEVLLVEDPTSALDAHTESLIAQRLVQLRSGRQTMITTKSPLLLTKADVVYFLAAGKVVASGTHQDLLSNCEYQNIVSRGSNVAPSEAQQ